jgi:hypothetical protein
MRCIPIFFLEAIVSLRAPLSTTWRPEMVAASNTLVRASLVLLAALVLFSLLAYYNKNVSKAERFTAAEVVAAPDAYEVPLPMAEGQRRGGASAAQYPLDRTSGGVAALEPYENEPHLGVEGQGGPLPKDPFPQDRLAPEDLLPHDAANSKWAQANPAGQGDVKDQNFLTAGYHLGVDTQGSSLRNASHDLRSTPPNPRMRVSIWNQSDIEPDMHRLPLE